MARPSKLTPATRDEIITRLAGGESLNSICRSDHLPTKANVLIWVVDDRDGFHGDYMRAREAAGYSHADESADVRNEIRSGAIDAQQAQAILKSLHWAAERMAPKRHSPRQEVTGQGGEPIQPRPAIDPSKLSDSALEELMAARDEQCR
mgnify:FL=1